MGHYDEQREEQLFNPWLMQGDCLEMIKNTLRLHESELVQYNLLNNGRFTLH